MRDTAGQPAGTYIQQLCADTGCSPVDLPEAMDNREGWRKGSGISVLMERHDDDDNLFYGDIFYPLRRGLRYADCIPYRGVIKLFKRGVLGITLNCI